MQSKTLEQLVAMDAAVRLVAFRDTVSRAFPGAIEDVVLFGSRARGDATADSAWEHVIDGYAIVPRRLKAVHPAGLVSWQSRRGMSI